MATQRTCRSITEDRQKARQDAYGVYIKAWVKAVEEACQKAPFQTAVERVNHNPPLKISPFDYPKKEVARFVAETSQKICEKWNHKQTASGDFFQELQYACEEHFGFVAAPPARRNFKSLFFRNKVSR